MSGERKATPADAAAESLRVGGAGDRFEREADRVAELVAGGAERLDDGPPLAEGPSLASAAPGLQRKCACGGEGGSCSCEEKDESQAGGQLQRKAHPGAESGRVGREFGMEGRPGSPLPPALRRGLESRMGHDFGRVRVHAGGEAASRARQVAAHAYTVGPNVVFGDGLWKPHSREGLELLAHELTHVIQQGAAPPLSGGLVSGPGGNAPAPGQAPGQTPGQASGHTPGQASGHTPGQTPGQASGHTPGQASGHTPGQAPGRTPGQASGQTPGQASGQTPGQASGRLAATGTAGTAGPALQARAAPGGVPMTQGSDGPEALHQPEEPAATTAAAAGSFGPPPVESPEPPRPPASPPPISRLASVRLQRDPGDPPAATDESEAAEAAEEVEPPAARLIGSLETFQFEPRKEVKLGAGSKDLQGFEFLAKRLLDAGYKKGDGAEIYKALGSPVPGFTPDINASETFPTINADVLTLSLIVERLEKQGRKVALSPHQRRLLELGVFGDFAFRRVDQEFPPWFTQSLFLRLIGRRIGLLERYHKAFEASEAASPSEENLRELAEAEGAVTKALAPPTHTLDAIRADRRLAGHEVYRKLWPHAEDPNEMVASYSPPGGVKPRAEDQEKHYSRAGLHQVPDLRTASTAIEYIAARPELAELARATDEDGHLARKELMDGIRLVLGWQDAPESGDQPLTEAPPHANVPPFDSHLEAYPPINPPLFDAAKGSIYSFSVNVDYPTIWAAFASKTYKFERIVIPKKEVVGAAERLESLPATEAGSLEVLGTRLAKDVEYNADDLETIYGDFALRFGMPGVTIDPLQVNAVMRYAGSVVKTGFEAAFDKPWSARMTFPAEGLYMVRSTVNFLPSSRDTIRRPPSIAYLPVFARDPAVLAESKLEQKVQEEEQLERILDDLRERYKEDPDFELYDQISELEDTLGGAFRLLHLQKRQLTETLLRGKKTLSDDEKSALERQIEKIDEVLELRKKRGFRPTSERLLAVMVTDAGDVVHLLLEAREVTEEGDDKVTWHVTDSTTPKGKQATRQGDDRADAIAKAVEALLAKGGYGRGRVSLRIDDVAHSIKVTASGTAILSEALDNASLILSLVAVAAAPFTAGQSLYLLIPAGIIGAIPSAYRIIDRAIDGTFKMDLETALDIVNIAGAAIGLGAEAQIAKRSLMVGGTLMVTGIGAGGAGIIMMGAQLVKQMEAVKELPPSIRTTAMMEILGHAMLSAGIAVGGALAARARVKSKLKNTAAGAELESTGWWDSINEETRTALKGDPALMRVYMEMDPGVRRLLTLCESLCVMKPPPTKTQQQHIADIDVRLDPAEQRLFKSFLHKQAGGKNLTRRLRDWKNLPDAKLKKRVRGATDPVEAVLLAFSESVKGDPSKGPLTPSQELLRSQVEAVVSAGHFSVDTIGAVLDNVRRTTGGNPNQMLRWLEVLGDRQIPGTAKLVGDLGAHFNFHKGAKWVLRYIDESGLWDHVQQFEFEATPQGRRWDAIINGVAYEFKSWGTFYPEKFLSQILQDYRNTNGFQNRKVRWAFEDGGGQIQGGAAGIIKAMEDALDNALANGRAGFTRRVVADIKRELASSASSPGLKVEYGPR